MARPRKPSRQRELDGNPGRRPVPKEPEVPRADGRPPAWLPRDAAVLWESFLPQMRQWIFASKLDEPMLAFLCGTFGFAMAAGRKLKREGLVREGGKNPAAQIWKDNVALFCQIAAKFGMTPADRARLFAGDQPPDGDQAKLAVKGDTLDGNWAPRVN